MDAWRKSIDLTLLVYKLTRAFPKEEIYGITQQIRKAPYRLHLTLPKAVQEKMIRKLFNFCTLQWTSLAELETQLIISHKLGYGDILKPTELEAIVKQLLNRINKIFKNKNVKR